MRKDLKARILTVANAVDIVGAAKIIGTKEVTAAPRAKSFESGHKVSINKNLVLMGPGGRQVDLSRGTAGVVSGTNQKNKGRYKVNFGHLGEVTVPAAYLKAQQQAGAKTIRAKGKKTLDKARNPPKAGKPVKIPGIKATKTKKRASADQEMVVVRSPKGRAASSKKEAAKPPAVIAGDCIRKHIQDSGKAPNSPTQEDYIWLEDHLGRAPSAKEKAQFDAAFASQARMTRMPKAAATKPVKKKASSILEGNDKLKDAIQRFNEGRRK